ncbi:SH3 domain-containing protein [Jejudonia soesokkakensis]|uniref:SH3 domain-containing protein n=1 Tax=Jejudonia soesokkakensis TaxID=1323432 RepID=A0ABW2MMY2_9FLAO
MKKVAFSIVALAILTLFTACKNEQTETPTEETKELAVNDSPVETTETYLYVTAPSGLTLREHNNLNSEKLAVMPYGTKLKVIVSETENTMNVGGIDGGMNKVEYNHKTGFAFNGFLSKFFPPERDMKAKMYVADLQKKFPEASYTESTGGTASKPTNSETVILPTQNWHEAFYIAQKLYDIPSSFSFPNPKGRDAQTIQNSNKPEAIFLSDLQIERIDNNLDKIAYVQAGTGYGSSVTLTKQDNTLKIVYSYVIE